MSKIFGVQPPYSVVLRQKYGLPNANGRAIFGISLFGDDNDGAGIYQQRKCHEGKVNIRMRFYWPFNPQTGPQQTNRGKFAAGVTAWQNLTSEQKQVYYINAKGKKLSGYNLFLRGYMAS